MIRRGDKGDKAEAADPAAASPARKQLMARRQLKTGGRRFDAQAAEDRQMSFRFTGS
jgi:hypothetical protein